MKILRLVLVLALALAALAVPAAASSGAHEARGLPELVDVVVQHRAGTDRVVFQFRHGLPTSVRTAYVDHLVADPSGRPVRIAGRAVLQVRLFPTDWTGATTAPSRRAFATPNVMTAVRSGRFEGVTTYGIGLAKRTDVAVRRVPRLDRVVVDIRATFPTVVREVFFFDVDRFLANTEPFFVPRKRPVRVMTPATGMLDRLFAGPMRRERDHGLRLLRSSARSFADLSIRDRIGRVRLVGGCDSGGSTVTIAGEIMPTLRQFATVDWVKIYGPGGRTADPTGPSDSIPVCLNP